MKHANQKVVEAFASLKGNHHFNAIIEWIVESRQESEQRLVDSADLVSIHREQGAVKCLGEIVDLERDCQRIVAENRRNK